MKGSIGEFVKKTIEEYTGIGQETFKNFEKISKYGKLSMRSDQSQTPFPIICKKERLRGRRGSEMTPWRR